MYGDNYIFYDYKSPLGIPRDKADSYDLVIADPPFLSEECLTKTAVTIKYLTKQKIILCTGMNIFSSLVSYFFIIINLKHNHIPNFSNYFFFKFIGAKSIMTS